MTVVLAASFGMSLGMGAIARAAEDATPDKALNDAKESFEAAQTFFVRGEYDAAAAKFLEAYNKKPFPAFLFNVAVSYEKAKQLEKAKEYFERYLKDDPNASDAAQVQAAPRRARQAARATAAAAPAAPPAPGATAPRREHRPRPVAPPEPGAPGRPERRPPPPERRRPRTGPTARAGNAGAAPRPRAARRRCSPTSTPRGWSSSTRSRRARRSISTTSGRARSAQTPWHGSLESKPVRLILESKGWKAEERQVSPRSDKLIDVYIALSEEHYLGWIEISSNVVGADLFIDRKDIGAIGRTPFTGQLKPGKHTIFLEKFGYQPMQQEIDVPAGTAMQHNLPMQKSQAGWITITGKTTRGGAASSSTRSSAARPPAAPSCRPASTSSWSRRRGSRTTRPPSSSGRGSRPPSRFRCLRARRAGTPSRRRRGAGDPRRGRLRRLPVESKQEQPEERHQRRPADRQQRLAVQLREVEAIGADVLYGVGAIVAATALYGFFEHGPDSTGVAEHRSDQPGAAVRSGRDRLAFTGRF